mgnify:CR=1 FL=1
MTRASGISGLLASVQSSGKVRIPLVKRKTNHDSLVSMSCVSCMLTASSGNQPGNHFDSPIACHETAWFRSAYWVLATSEQAESASASVTIRKSLRVFIGGMQVISRGNFHRDDSSRTSASNSQQGLFVQMIVQGDLPIDPQRSRRQSRP